MENESNVKISNNSINLFDNVNPDNKLSVTNNKQSRVMLANSNNYKFRTNRHKTRSNNIIIRDQEQRNHVEDCKHLKKDEVSNNHEGTLTYNA